MWPFRQLNGISATTHASALLGIEPKEGFPMKSDLITSIPGDCEELIQKYFTTKELAAIVRRDRATLENARVSGKGDYPAFIRVGRQVLYPASEVKAWLNKRQRFHTTAEADAAREAA